jgi:acetyl-CoA acetyltransferase
MKSQFSTAVYVQAAYRSPIGKFGGSLKNFSAAQLAGTLLKKIRLKTAYDKKIDAVFLGHAGKRERAPILLVKSVFFPNCP